MDPTAAADALGILREERRRVRRRARREQGLILGARAVTTVLWMGRKDIRDPVRRRVVGAGLVLGMIGLGLWEFDRSKVSRLWSERVVEQRTDLGPDETERRDPDPSDSHPSRDERLRAVFSSLTPAGKWAVVVGAVVVLARPLVVRGFRRSGVRYPNLAAGVVTAAMSTAAGLAGMRSRPATDDEDD